MFISIISLETIWLLLGCFLMRWDGCSDQNFNLTLTTQLAVQCTVHLLKNRMQSGQLWQFFLHWFLSICFEILHKSASPPHCNVWHQCISQRLVCSVYLCSWYSNHHLIHIHIKACISINRPDLLSVQCSVLTMVNSIPHGLMTQIHCNVWKPDTAGNCTMGFY